MPTVIDIGNIREYIDDKFYKLRNWLIEYENLDKEEYNIKPKCCENLIYKGTDGYSHADKLVMARYCPNEKEPEIKFGLTGIQSNVENIRTGILNGEIQIPYDMKFDYVDMIVFHELAHVYQHKYEGKILKRDDVQIEQEADEKAIMWYREYASQQGKNLEAINIVVEYYRGNRS